MNILFELLSASSSSSVDFINLPLTYIYRYKNIIILNHFIVKELAMLFSQILKTEYDLVSVLNRSESGGKNTLIRYRHRKTGRDIAVRKFPSDTDVSVYKLLCKYSSEYLTQIYDVVCESDCTYIVEEYVDSTPLSEFLPLNERGAKKALEQICQGLYALHSLGIIHRDIKESNVLVDIHGNIKLTDFDISKLKKADTLRDTTILGTVTYAPPEQYGLAQSDFRSDIYALGILTNIMLTGVHPSVKMYKKGRLGKIIARSTMIDPNERFDSVTEILDML